MLVFLHQVFSTLLPITIHCRLNRCSRIGMLFQCPKNTFRILNLLGARSSRCCAIQPKSAVNRSTAAIFLKVSVTSTAILVKTTSSTVTKVFPTNHNSHKLMVFPPLDCPSSSNEMLQLTHLVLRKILDEKP